MTYLLIAIFIGITSGLTSAQSLTDGLTALDAVNPVLVSNNQDRFSLNGDKIITSQGNVLPGLPGDANTLSFHQRAKQTDDIDQGNMLNAFYNDNNAVQLKDFTIYENFEFHAGLGIGTIDAPIANINVGLDWYPNFTSFNSNTWIGTDVSLNYHPQPDIPEDNRAQISPRDIPYLALAFEAGFSPWRTEFNEPKKTYFGLRFKILREVYTEYSPGINYAFTRLNYLLPNIFVGYAFKSFYTTVHIGIFKQEKSVDRNYFFKTSNTFYGVLEVGYTF